MAFKERHHEILRIIARLKTVAVPDLTERLGVSEVAIRKDLSLLEEQGKLIRTHGGAILAEDSEQQYNLSLRRQENVAQKKRSRCGPGSWFGKAIPFLLIPVQPVF